jgi:hypothetical protein
MPLKTDDIGYGRPPTQTRWQPGQSGNPKGRPKASTAALLEGMADILSAPVKARGGDGRVVELGGLEASYLALCKKALKGDNGALFQAIKVMLEVILAGDALIEERDAEVRGSYERFVAIGREAMKARESES